MGFSLAEIEAATGGKVLAGDACACGRVVIDSRRVEPGDLFIAIPGERFDGHDFAAAAFSAGARAAVVSRPVPAPAGAAVVLVRDTVKALGDLARFHRRRYSLPIVSVTGSTGKTTTKEMIAAIGAIGRRVAKTTGNMNNEIGLPLTLLELQPEDGLLVVEMGMRGPGQIAYLAGVAEPGIGVVTNIGVAHLELLGTQAAIARAKAELLEALPGDGAAVINADDAYASYLAERTRARVLGFGFGSAAAIRAIDVHEIPGGSEFTIAASGWRELKVVLNVPGLHQVANALAAAAVAHALGYPPEHVREGLAGFSPERGRGLELQSAGGWTVIDDTYNANPASVTAALRALASRPCRGRRVAILADMLELGPAAATGHRSVGAAAAGSGLALLLTYGDLAAQIGSEAAQAGLPSATIRHYRDKERLTADLLSWLRPGDLILVKGSRGMHMEDIVDSLAGGITPRSAGG